MTKFTNRDFSCERTGKILSKEKRKVYDKKSPFWGNNFFRLDIALENEKSEKFLFVYPNLVSPEIFHTIEQSHYIDKRYHFFCEKRKRGLMLHRWQELSPNITASFNQEKSQQNQKNYEPN